jgi:hypothetical protein
MIDWCTKRSNAMRLPFKHTPLDLLLLTVSVPIKIQLKLLAVVIKIKSAPGQIIKQK